MLLGAILNTGHALGAVAHHRVAQRLALHPGRRAASARLIPSSALAIAYSRAAVRRHPPCLCRADDLTPALADEFGRESQHVVLLERLLQQRPRDESALNQLVRLGGDEGEGDVMRGQDIRRRVDLAAIAQFDIEEADPNYRSRPASQPRPGVHRTQNSEACLGQNFFHQERTRNSSSTTRTQGSRSVAIAAFSTYCCLFGQQPVRE